eukprot:5293666-Amphidinium_carterae.1
MSLSRTLSDRLRKRVSSASKHHARTCKPATLLDAKLELAREVLTTRKKLQGPNEAGHQRLT